MTAVDITGVLGSVWGEATERERVLAPCLPIPPLADSMHNVDVVGAFSTATAAVVGAQETAVAAVTKAADDVKDKVGGELPVLSALDPTGPPRS